ncbi:MAG: hypothetical protein JNM57_00465 [Cyclobacteriaceae bacterium]|nr:hypothetical protein [Cyclobacteriaceae bacterium]
MMKFIGMAFLMSFSLCVMAQSIQIKDIYFKEGYHFDHTDPNNFRLIYKIASRNPNTSLFRKIDFDTLLSITDTTLINMGGSYRLITSASNHRYTATLFASTSPAHMVLHILGEHNYKRSIIFQTKVPWKKKMTFYLISSADPGVFYILYPFDKKNWEIQCVSVDDKVLWKKEISGGNEKLTLSYPFIVDQRLVVLASLSPLKNKESHALHVIDPQSGNIISTLPIAGQYERNTVDNVFFQDSTMFITGRKFFTRGTSDKANGMPYVKFIRVRGYGI